ncbi:MAG: hypothetical protein WCV79_04490 [Candidatus Paceibacterota bacterium]
MAILPAGEIPQNPSFKKGNTTKKAVKSSKGIRPLSKKQVEKLKGEFSIPSWMIKDN